MLAHTLELAMRLNYAQLKALVRGQLSIYRRINSHGENQ